MERPRVDPNHDRERRLRAWAALWDGAANRLSSVVGLLWALVAGLGSLTIVSAAMATFKWNCDRPTPLPSQGSFGLDPYEVTRQNAERCQSFLGGLEGTVYVALGASGALLLAYGLFRHFRDKLTHRADMLREDSE